MHYMDMPIDTMCGVLSWNTIKDTHQIRPTSRRAERLFCQR